MKATYALTAAALALTFGIAACVPSVTPPAPAPAPPPVAPAPTPTPPPPPPPVTEPVYENWLDAPQTPGDWEYSRLASGSQAVFGNGDPATSLIVSCVMPERRVTLTRPIDTGAQRVMRIRTETVTRDLTATSAPGGTPATVASLDARDPLLDAMAITKGRFAVGLEGARTLYVPAWVEVSRVIEDCR
ncbi:MAG: hypothetical protein V2J14_03350 [Erythrobacter sp.]|nr:hypothetical protein [Erythrobacter sp.]